MASIYEQAQAFRAALIKRDTAAIEYLTNQYSAIYKRLVRDLEAVTSQIAAAQASGEKVSRAWLNRQFRYQEFLRQLDREFRQYGSTVASLVQARQFFEAQQGANDAATITGSFARLNIGAIENVVANLRESSPLGRLLAGFGDDAAAHVGSVLRDAIVKGENPRKIAGQVRDALNIPLWRALRIARTEATRAYRQSTLDAYAANERVTGWYWLASKSRRTCLACLALDGQFFPKDKPQKAHIACRCTAVPGVQDQPAPKRETAGQWFAKQPDSVKREMMSGSAFDAYKAGKVDLRDFVGLAKSSKWGDQYHELSLRRALNKEASFPSFQPPKIKFTAQPTTINKPGSFATIAEAEAWASQKFPHMEFDFSGADIRAMNPVLKRFESLANEYPEVVKRMKFISTYEKAGKGEGLFKDGVYAHAYTSDGRGIGLNARWFGNLNKFNAALKNDVEKGWHPIGTDSAEAVFTHEFGHLVDGWLRTQSGAAFSRVVSGNGLGFVIDTVLQWQDGNKATPKLSRYAMTKREEAWAEGFAAIYHTPKKQWPQFVKNQAKLLKGLQELPRYQEGEWEFLGRLSSDARPAARQELIEALKKLGMKL